MEERCEAAGIKSYIHICAEDVENFVECNFKAFENPQPQFFDLPDTVIHYLLTAGTSKIYEKLIQTCKYFFSKKRVTVFPNIVLRYTLLGEVYEPKRILTLQNDQLSKIWITKWLFFFRHFFEKQPYSAISKFCEKIYKCEATSIALYDQNITQEEFHILVHPDFVKYLDLTRITIMNTTTKVFLNLEDVVKRVPNAESLYLIDIPYTSNTFSILADIKRAVKLSQFYCKSGIPSDSHKFFQLNVCQKFITKHAAPKSIFCFDLENIETSVLETYKAEMKEFAYSWNPIEDKPEIYLRKEETSYANHLIQEDDGSYPSYERGREMHRITCEYLLSHSSTFFKANFTKYFMS